MPFRPSWIARTVAPAPVAVSRCDLTLSVLVIFVNRGHSWLKK
jgi:hypothetical protein